jgi:hypothetical protein
LTTKSPGPRWETPVPPGVTGSYGNRVIAWSRRELGITFGRWQAHAIRNALRHDRHGDLVHRIVLLSTARQNGKSVIVRGLYGWLLDEGRCLPPFAGWTTILAAAHDAKQARIIYKGVYNDLSGIERLQSQGYGPRTGKPVRLTEHFGITVEGLNLDTVTGQPGSSRGLSAGAIAWDEMLTQKDWDMWEALSPTQSAQRSPIMLLTSTAGHADSVVLRSFYDRLRRQASGDEDPDPAFYGAWWESEDPDAGLDWEQIGQANPALGDGRLARTAIVTEHGLLPPDSWRRERLNHFVDVTAPGAFNPGVWAACRTDKPLDGLDGPYALGVDVQPGWDRATICVAGLRGDGRVGVEVYRDIRATPLQPVTSKRITAEIARFEEPLAAIVYDSISGAAAEFRRHGVESGLPYQEVKRGDFVTACMDVTEMIQAGRLAVDDPLLDAQIPNAARRMVGMDGAFCFSRAQSLGPIDAIIAMTFAAHQVASGAPVPNIY